MQSITYIFTSFPQGQTALDVADEDVLGYLEELQKKQNLVSQFESWLDHIFLQHDAS